MALSDFILSFQTCPIVLVQGVAGSGVMPISQLLNPSADSSSITANTSSGFVTGSDQSNDAGSDSVFGSFRVLPGGTLMRNETAHFPLASQAVAANAVITQELAVSVEMVTPAGGDVSMSRRLSIFTSLKNVLDNHTAMGGYYNVATPAFIYTGCLLLDLVDGSDVPDGAQTQTKWIWNFEQPLITLQQAQVAVNNAMGKIGDQTYNAGDPPGSKPLATSVSNPTIGQQVTPKSDNSAGVTNTVPVSPGGGNYI